MTRDLRSGEQGMTVPVDATLEAAIRRDRRVVVTALIAVIALSWTSPRVSAFGRKRTFVFVGFGASERPLWRKADISEYPQDFHKIDQLGTSAFRPKAVIKLISSLMSANDRKRSLAQLAI